MYKPATAAPTAKPKRRRICVSQSKRGCLTCKARRVKCDEATPTCRRCEESARRCAGYAGEQTIDSAKQETDIEASAPESTPGVSTIAAPLPIRILSSGLWGDERQNRCARIGTQLISSASFASIGTSGLILDRIVAQTCNTVPSVHAAAIALGSVYEWLASEQGGIATGYRFATSQYQLALDAMRKDLVGQQDGQIPLILACFLLSVLEMFRREEINSLIHLRGAYKLMSRAKSRKSLQTDIDLTSLEDHIELVLRAIDFQTWSYAPSKELELSGVQLPSSSFPVKDIKSAHVSLIRLVHLCYEFRSKNERFRYYPQSAAPSLYIQQGRLIAQLSMWIEQLTINILPTLTADKGSLEHEAAQEHALTLRVIALSTMISLSCAICPYETAFDVYAVHFETILADCEALALIREKEDYNIAKKMNGWRYQAGPGIVEPLLLTATKCRHPCHRRRAIRLLTIAGCEGPWIGAREASISHRIVQLEEEHSGFELQAEGHDPDDSCLCIENQKHPSAATVTLSPERARIHKFGLTSLCMNGSVPRKVQATFRRCSNIDGLLSSNRGQSPNPNDKRDSNLNEPHQISSWETWAEILDV